MTLGNGRNWMILGLPALFLACLAGCNVLAPFYFAAILAGKDARIPPAFEFPEDARRILVVTYVPMGTQLELGHFDHEVNEALSRRLFEGFTADRVDIQVIKASKLAKWQDENPDWRSMEPGEIGRALKADYVIYLELDNPRLFEEDSNKMLYRGRAEVGVSVVRVTDEDGEVVLPEETLGIDFPRGRPVPVSSDMPLAKFRREFIRRMTEQISWLFLPHETGDEFARDPL